MNVEQTLLDAIREKMAEVEKKQRKFGEPITRAYEVGELRGQHSGLQSALILVHEVFETAEKEAQK